MSMEAYRWALTWNGLSSPQKFVLVMIGDHYNEDVHRAWPSIERLANETALSRRTVIRAIQVLEEEGLVQVEPWVRADHGGKLTNRYCLPGYDSRSVCAKHLPVVAEKTFDHNGNVTYDTTPHWLKYDEEMSGYAAA